MLLSAIPLLSKRVISRMIIGTSFALISIAAFLRNFDVELVARTPQTVTFSSSSTSNYDRNYLGRRFLQSKGPQSKLDNHDGQEGKKQAPIISKDKYLGLAFPKPEKMPLYLRNTMEPLNDSDIYFYWHIPKAAGSLMKAILSNCYGFRRAEKLKHPVAMEMVKDTILNVDTATPAGIVQAQSLGIANSGMVDVIISSYVLSGSSLFTPLHHGRGFTLMRHPVDTAASIFEARKEHRPDLRNLGLSLAQYVSQDWYPDNFIVRQLTGVLPGLELNEVHLEHAKNLLSAKFFVGIVEQMEETMRQLKLYFGWQELEGKEGCAMQLVRGGSLGGNGSGGDQYEPGVRFGFHQKLKAVSSGKPKRGSEEWAIVTEKEKWDLELYYFGLEMFSRQSQMFPIIPDQNDYFS